MAVQDIWLLPLPDIPFAQLLAREGHVMTQNEHDQLANKRLPKGKHMYAFTRIVLRHVLSRYETHVAPGQWRFSRKSAGKPTISEPGSTLHFNLTHADDLLVIAVCDYAEVGVDVEDRKREVDVLALARRYYQNNEIRELELQADPETQRTDFLTLWTLKEAAVKATGKGLSKALRDFSFTFLSPGLLEVQQGSGGQECALTREKTLPEFYTFAWRDYLLSAAKLLNTDPAEPTTESQLSTDYPESYTGDMPSVAGWRLFCWEWPDIHPVSVSPALLWKSVNCHDPSDDC